MRFVLVVTLGLVSKVLGARERNRTRALLDIK